MDSWRDRYPEALLARACLARAKGHSGEAERLAEGAIEAAGEATPSSDSGLLACAGITLTVSQPGT